MSRNLLETRRFLFMYNSNIFLLAIASHDKDRNKTEKKNTHIIISFELMLVSMPVFLYNHSYSP